MSYTKAQARSMVKALIPDPQNDKWPAGALDVLLSTTIDELWGDLLDSASYASSQTDIFSSLTTPGIIDLRTVAGGGNLSQRFYRVQKVKRNGREYTEADRASTLVINNAEVVSSKFSWAIYGTQLWLFPLDTINSTEFQYSFLPPAYITLNDTDVVDWPDGTEGAYIFEAVARALAEAPDGANRSIAMNALAKAKANVTRLGLGPQTINTYDTPEEWGGNA